MAKDKSENQETLDLIKDLVKDVKVTMMTTISDGMLVSRPMRTQEIEFGEEIWFLTKKDTDKYRELKQNPAINLSYADKSYVSISGTAEFVQDEEKKKEYWNPILGRLLETSVDDPEVVLIRVIPEKAEYWESGINMKTVKEFARKMTKSNSLQENNDLKRTVRFDDGAR